MIQKLFAQESRSIAAAALIIGASAVASRFLGLIRDRLLVSRFGLGELDAYYASFQIPNFLFALLVLGTLSAAFIPVFSDYLAKGKREEAFHVANAVLTVAAAVMGVLCLVLMIGAPWVVRLVAPGFEGEKLELTVRLTRVMMLSPFFFAVSAVFSSILNSFKRFGSVALAPLFYNAALIFGILALSKPFGILGVAYGAILGAVLHVLVQLPELRKAGFRMRRVWDLRHQGVRDIGRLFLPRVFGIDISQISQFLGSIIGTTLGAGSVSIFNLAMNIAAVPIGAVAIPFAIAAFPNLSEAAAKGERATFIRVFASTFRQILFFTVPLSVMAVILRNEIVRVLIGPATERFTAADARLTAAAFALFCVTLAVQGLVPLLARAFYALKNTVVPVVVSFAAMAVNILGAYAMISWTAFGSRLLRSVARLLDVAEYDYRALALPLAFSVAALIQVVLLAVRLRKLHGRIGGAGLLPVLCRIGVGGVAAGLAAWAMTRGHHAVTGTFMESLLRAGGATVVGLAAYVIALRLLGSEELQSIIDVFRRKLVRKPEVDEIQEGA